MDPKQRRILMIVENLPVPFDRRVWQEARTLTEAGYRVSIISPMGRGYEKRHEVIEGIEIFRHPLGFEANGAAGYIIEYGLALFWETWLALRIFMTRGFDVIHACNPPDLIFLVAWPYRFLLGKKFVFDHHDVCPELFLAKFKKKNALYWLMRVLERLTFMSANATIATNDSYREIAIRRGKKAPERVFVVRSGPDLARMKIVPADARWRGDFKHLVGYLGVMGSQEGIPYLLRAAHHAVFTLGRRDVKFLLIGDGPAYAELVQMRDELGLGPWVEFTGRIPDDELRSALCSCDVCVNPDEVTAMNDVSTMNKVLEYMALARPIVQFEVREGRVSAGEASVYARANDAIDFAEKVVELLDAPEEVRRRMGEFGRWRVESKLAWVHQRSALLACYGQVLGEQSGEGLPAQPTRS